jgi:hypothetical protein
MGLVFGVYVAVVVVGELMLRNTRRWGPHSNGDIGERGLRRDKTVIKHFNVIVFRRIPYIRELSFTISLYQQ